MKNKYRIACSPLTGRFYCGKLNKAGNAFINGKEDATSDILAALIDKARFHGGEFDIEGNGGRWTVTVTESVAKAKGE